MTMPPAAPVAPPKSKAPLILGIGDDGRRSKPTGKPLPIMKTFTHHGNYP